MHSLSSHLESLGLSHDTGRAYVQAMRWFLDYVIIWRYMRGTGKKSMDDARGIFKALIPLAAKRNKQDVRITKAPDLSRTNPSTPREVTHIHVKRQ